MTNFRVTGLIKTPEGRYQMRINGTPYWTDARGWGLYTATSEIQISRTGLRKKVRVPKMVASPAEFRLPSSADLAAQVVEQDLQIAVRARKARAESAQLLQTVGGASASAGELVGA